MTNVQIKRQYTAQEEIFNSVSHGLAALLSVVCFIILVVNTSGDATPLRRICFGIYTFSLVLLYLASTVYHAVSEPKLKVLLRKVDHLSIFILIAGTYTPLALLSIGGTLGWTIFYAAWALALFGIIYELFLSKGNKWVFVGIYVAMGWGCVLAIKPVIERVPHGLLWWLLAGGLFYTFGTLFYVKKSMKHHHFIWHLFVFLGSAMHFIGIYKYLA